VTVRSAGRCCGRPTSLTAEESAERAALRYTGTDIERPMDLPGHEPTPMVPILQLYLRDTRGVVAGPQDADLVQVLWCPFNHNPEYMPTTSIHWRRADDVRRIVDEPPTPDFIETAGYLPETCVLHPEPVTEYPPQLLLLPEEINVRLEEWMESEENQIPVEFDDERDAVYAWALSVAPGWKMGGWAPASFGRSYGMQIYTCPVSFDHAAAEKMQ
jgi:hypothetical protein